MAGSNEPKVPSRLFIIDEGTRDEYAYLQGPDHCYYIWERMSQLWSPTDEKPDYNRYPANNLISNLKIPISTRLDNPKRFYWKSIAISYCAGALSQLLPQSWKDNATFIPVPPSKLKASDDYDDRLEVVLRSVKPLVRDIRDLVLLTDESIESTRKGVSPYERVMNYIINEDVATPDPQTIFLFDDILTTGCHFKAIQSLLAERFPDASVFGLFIARAVRPNPDEPSVFSTQH